MNSYTVEIENRALNDYHLEYLFMAASEPCKMALSHLHPAVEILLFTAGGFRLEVDGEECFASEGDLAVFRSNAVHAIELISRGAGSYHVLKLHPSLLLELFSQGGENHAMPLLQNRKESPCIIPRERIPGEVSELFSRIAEEDKEGNGTARIAQRIYASELSLLLLRRVLPRGEEAPGEERISTENLRRIYESVSYIDRSFSSELRAEEVAARIHMSYSYYARLFRAVTGKSFQQYLQSVRLSHAERLLLTTELSVTEIAMSCGYNSLSYFISEYKRVKGHTPRASRREG